jgi:hypothetical protein
LVGEYRKAVELPPHGGVALLFQKFLRREPRSIARRRIPRARRRKGRRVMTMTIILMTMTKQVMRKKTKTQAQRAVCFESTAI